jgi:hypothetical protein
LATEKRLLALTNQHTGQSLPSADPSTSPFRPSFTGANLDTKSESPSEDGDDDDSVEFVSETDNQRREALLFSEKAEDLKGMKSGSLLDYFNGFNFPCPSQESKEEGKKGESPQGIKQIANLTATRKEVSSKGLVKSEGLVSEVSTLKQKSLPDTTNRKDEGKSTSTQLWSCLVCTL